MIEVLHPVESPVITSALDSLEISTDADYLDVSIFFGDVIVYESRLYCYLGKVTVWMLGDICSDFLKQINRPAGEFVAKANGVIADTFFAIQCGRFPGEISSAEFLEKNFLMSSRLYVLPSSSVLQVSAFVPSAGHLQSLKYRVDFKNGLRSIFSPAIAEPTSYPAVVSFNVSRETLEGAYPMADIVGVRVTMADATLWIRYDDSLSLSDAFIFTNTFGCADMVFIRGNRVSKYSAKVQETISGNRKYSYNNTTEFYTELSSAPLEPDIIQSVSQLIEASHVYVKPTGRPGLMPVMFQDSEVSEPSLPEESPTVTVKYTSSSRFPYLRPEGEYAEQSDSARIFTSQFLWQFS